MNSFCANYEVCVCVYVYYVCVGGGGGGRVFRCFYSSLEGATKLKFAPFCSS